MYKSLSSSFHKKIDFYAAKESTIGEAAMAEFGVKKVPSLVVIKAGVVALYDGTFRFLTQTIYSCGTLTFEFMSYYRSS